jgi:hypothetical protein
MGGKKPDPPSPEIVMQKPTAPTLFRTVVPEESYQDVANYAGRLNQQLRSALQEQYRQAGTSAEIGARQRGIEMQEAADIASSMPTGRDPGFMGVALDKDGGVDNAATAKMTGAGGTQGSGQYSQAKKAADLRLADAKKAYSKAKARIGEKDYLPKTNQKFSWAKDQSSVFDPADPADPQASKSGKSKDKDGGKKEFSSKDIKNPFLALIDYQHHAKRGAKPDFSEVIERSNNPDKQDRGYFERITGGRGKPG